MTMFKEEIKNIFNKSIIKLESIGNTCTFYDLLKTNLHPAILQYISAELDYVVFEDRLKFSESTLINYKDTTFNESFNIIADDVKKNKVFEKEYFIKLILYAVSFNINFITQPIETVKKFLFDGKEIKTKTEIAKTINYFYYYDYLRKAVQLFLDKSKDKIKLVEFNSYIDKVEEKLRTKYIRNVIKTFVNSISDFWKNIGNENIILSTNVVEVFLNEMKLDRARDKFLDEFTNRSGKLSDIKDIKIFFDFLFQGIFYSTSRITSESVKPTEKIIQHEEKVLTKEQTLKFEEESIVDGDEEELEVIYDLDETKDEIIEKNVINESHIKDEQVYEFGDAEYANIINDSIQGILSKKKINKVIEEVFDDDTESFIQTVERLLTNNTQDEAFIIIDKLFNSKGLKSNSRLAKIFKKTIAEYIDRVHNVR
ncbi:MAG: hypothetical protein JXA68_10230 [Ignavibacteriales bacterium]|nr:hypothetical protein [Ignavibacteriales bacterium]